MRTPQRPPNIDHLLANRGADLAATLSDHTYRDFARRAEASYWPWNRLRFAARSAGLDPELAWLLVKITRTQQYRYLPLVGLTAADKLRFMLPDLAQRELMLIDQELAGRVGEDADRPLAGQRERFVVTALQEEAIASSMLEGAITTRQEAKQLLRSRRRPRDNSERMIVNNYQTMMFIRETLDQSLSLDYLLEIQEHLTRGTLQDSDHVGRFRKSTDDVEVVDERDGQVMHCPPPADELVHRLDSLCEFANAADRNDDFIHPVVKACVLHFQIGFDHPFCDGNGRTARAVFYWYLLRRGYWLFEFLPISPLYQKSPAKYARAYLYAETDDFDVTYFLHYNLTLISRARAAFREHVRKKQDELQQAHAIFSSDGSLNHRQHELLSALVRNPATVTIADHQRTHGVAYATARSDLFDLADRGYLLRDRQKNKYVFTRGPRLEEITRRRIAGQANI